MAELAQAYFLAIVYALRQEDCFRHIHSLHANAFTRWARRLDLAARSLTLRALLPNAVITYLTAFATAFKAPPRLLRQIRTPSTAFVADDSFVQRHFCLTTIYCIYEVYL